MHDILHPKRMCSESRDLFKFWEISGNISDTVQAKDIVAIEDNRKSYVAYQMAPLSVIFSDFECHFCCLKTFSVSHNSENTPCVIYDMFTHEPESPRFTVSTCQEISEIPLCHAQIWGPILI